MIDLAAFPRDSHAFEILAPEVSPGRSRITLRYALVRDGHEPLHLREEVRLPPAPDGEVDGAAHDRLVRLLALAAAPSYYKTTCARTVSVPGGLAPGERDFLAAVIGHGLAEFAHRNDLPDALTPTIAAPGLPDPAAPGAPPPAEPPARGVPDALVAVGGGKDSVVTVEGLRAAGLSPVLFAVNDFDPIRETAEVARLPLVTAGRTLDPVLFDLNAAGAYNGHVPVTAVNSLVACLAALALGVPRVVFSNEHSASYGNLHWAGVEVNHQWSKGIGFERLLRRQLAGLPVDYVSFLRPLTELAIMRRFATLTGYHHVFTSCNRAFHIDAARRRRWCGECPKCRFVFLTLAPFLPRPDLLAIFGDRDLLRDPDQAIGFADLLNLDGRLKPFECVGEPDECRAAATLLSRQEEWREAPFLTTPAVQAALLDEDAVAGLFRFHDEHHLPPAYEAAARALL